MAHIPEYIIQARQFLASGAANQAEALLKSCLVDNENKNIAQQVMTLDLLGQALCAQRNFEEGIKTIEQAISLLEESKNFEDAQNRRFLVALYQNLGFARMEKGNYTDAFDAYQHGVDLAVQTGEAALLASASFAISALYYRQKKYDQAEAHVLQAKNLWSELGNNEKVGTCLNNLGRIYEEKGEMDTGIDFHREAVQLRRQLSNRADLAFSLGNLGVALATAGNFQEASERLKEAVRIYGELNLSTSPECRGYMQNLKLCEKFLRTE